MLRKRFSVKQIINHLPEADVRLAQGETAGEICRDLGVSKFAVEGFVLSIFSRAPWFDE